MSHPCRLTLDVIMENFWTRPSGVYRKPVWLRPNVLQLFYDDDNDGLKTFSGPAVPGGHSAFTGTASVYSQTPITKADLSLDSPNPVTNALRKEVTANLQRVGSCYLVQANLLGFAGSESGVVSEQIVLSASLKWALSDYATRFGKQPEQIVLHLDVNGTLALGDLAGSKSFAKMTQSLAKDLLADEKMSLTAEQKKALADAQEKEETELRTRFTANYSRQDFIRAIVLALSALAPSAIRELDRELSGDFAANFRTKSAAQAFSDAAAALESPALTLAIRTNGTEHRQAAVYVQRLIHCVLGTELSEERGTIRRYVTCHEDAARGLFYHPVLLEQLHKSNGEYTYEHYAADVNKMYEKEVTTAGAFEQISSGSLKKSDTKFKVYLGLCKGPDDKPASSSSDPPKLDVAFKRETWLMPGGKHKDYRCKEQVRDAGQPWWAGFAVDEKTTGATPAEEDFTGAFQPYNVPIAGEPVPGQGTMLAMADPNDPYGLLAPSSASVVQLANRQAAPYPISAMMRPPVSVEKLDLGAMKKAAAVQPTRLPNGSLASNGGINPFMSTAAAWRPVGDLDTMTPRSFRGAVKKLCAPEGGAYADPDQIAYTYDELTPARAPKANPLAQEMYLGDEEFKKVFGCDKEAFYALRAWRRRELKRQARLY